MDTQEELNRQKFRLIRLRRKKRRMHQLKKSTWNDTSRPNDDWTKATRETLHCKINPAEQHIHKLLNGCRVHFERERPIEVGGKRYFIDFLVTSIVDTKRKKVRVAIEVDGGYHFTPEQQEKDRLREKDLLSCMRVWSILRISATKAMSMTRDDLRAAIIANKVGSVTFY